jgi:hypothetical protein
MLHYPRPSGRGLAARPRITSSPVIAAAGHDERRADLLTPSWLHRRGKSPCVAPRPMPSRRRTSTAPASALEAGAQGHRRNAKGRHVPDSTPEELPVLTRHLRGDLRWPRGRPLEPRVLSGCLSGVRARRLSLWSHRRHRHLASPATNQLRLMNGAFSMFLLMNGAFIRGAR